MILYLTIISNILNDYKENQILSEQGIGWRNLVTTRTE